MSTSVTTLPIHGDKLYQQRARAALPILVRQAKAGMPIYYSDLALELNIPNARNLNYVLGSIGSTIEDLNQKHCLPLEIPAIQSIAINKNNKEPGKGFHQFFKEKNIDQLTHFQRKRLLDSLHHDVMLYPDWDRFLEVLGLTQESSDFTPIIQQACLASHAGEGESEEHQNLKQYIASHPESLHLTFTQTGSVEFKLPSGDSLDVSFQNRTQWIAIEVKPSFSTEQDLTRGIFQCVKYKAVMQAVLTAQEIDSEVKALLVLSGKMPEKLIKLAHTLGVQFIEEFKIIK